MHRYRCYKGPAMYARILTKLTFTPSPTLDTPTPQPGYLHPRLMHPPLSPDTIKVYVILKNHDKPGRARRTP